MKLTMLVMALATLILGVTTIMVVHRRDAKPSPVISNLRTMAANTTAPKPSRGPAGHARRTANLYYAYYAMADADHMTAKSWTGFDLSVAKDMTPEMIVPPLEYEKMCEKNKSCRCYFVRVDTPRGKGVVDCTGRVKLEGKITQAEFLQISMRMLLRSSER